MSVAQAPAVAMANSGLAPNAGAGGPVPGGKFVNFGPRFKGHNSISLFPKSRLDKNIGEI